MPRRHRLRKVVAPPRFKGYKPYGNYMEDKGFIELHYEEYEAIKLADYDLMNHQQAGETMGVSRPTFARIYESARRKIARALVEAKEIKTIYGNATIDKDWFVCEQCKAKFTLPLSQDHQVCPLCKSTSVHSISKH